MSAERLSTHEYTAVTVLRTQSFFTQVPITLDDISFGEEVSWPFYLLHNYIPFTILSSPFHIHILLMDQGFPLVTSLQLELKVPRAVDDPMDPRQLVS